MTDHEPLTRYLCLSVDVQRYGHGDDRRQSEVQRLLVALLDAAGRAAGLDRESWIRQPKGDEELALIPPSEPEPRVLDDFVRELATGLFRHNCDREPADRLRLRLALDHGYVQPAANGHSGRPVVAVSRLVNAAPLREALRAAPDAGLAVLLSQRVYSDLVLAGHTRLAAGLFREVAVAEKELAEPAWLRVPGGDVHRLRLESTVDEGVADGAAGRGSGQDDPPAAPGRDRGTASPGVVNALTGPVYATHAVFGVRHG